jgi:hypothetical protein
MLYNRNYVSPEICKPAVLFSIDCAILAYPFFGIGNIIHRTDMIKTIETEAGKKKIIKGITTVTGYLAIITAVKYNGKADVNNFIYGRDSLLFYMLGMAGIMSTVILSLRYKKEIKTVTVISNGTIIILAVHNLFNGWLYKIINILKIEQNLVVIIILSIINI